MTPDQIEDCGCCQGLGCAICDWTGEVCTICMEPAKKCTCGEYDAEQDLAHPSAL